MLILEILIRQDTTLGQLSFINSADYNQFFQTALGFVEETARCADKYLGVPKPKLMPPFERYNDRSFACPARPRYHGSGRIEGYWDVLFCEPCLTPRREVDKRISRRRLQDALHIDASH